MKQDTFALHIPSQTTLCSPPDRPDPRQPPPTCSSASEVTQPLDSECAPCRLVSTDSACIDDSLSQASFSSDLSSVSACSRLLEDAMRQMTVEMEAYDLALQQVNEIAEAAERARGVAATTCTAVLPLQTPNDPVPHLDASGNDNIEMENQEAGKFNKEPDEGTRTPTSTLITTSASQVFNDSSNSPYPGHLKSVESSEQTEAVARLAVLQRSLETRRKAIAAIRVKKQRREIHLCQQEKKLEREHRLSLLLGQTEDQEPVNFFSHLHSSYNFKHKCIHFRIRVEFRDYQ
ncbi:unnamed protein product [Protopolystoma xenopodis]|uniref:Uncharacterized protein n=1 Tax=Protopolystoma xenopodis TaxID=117903 RepID=A0A448XRR6_9PLAT|nr:unnamed protein product [Protopolystoma xenopodis]